MYAIRSYYALRFSHGLVAGQEIAHLITLNGRPSEYLKREDAISFFESTHDPYTLKGARLPGLCHFEVYLGFA